MPLKQQILHGLELLCGPLSAAIWCGGKSRGNASSDTRKKESLCTMWSVTDNFLPFYSSVMIGEERTQLSLKERSKDKQSIPNMALLLMTMTSSSTSLLLTD